MPSFVRLIHADWSTSAAKRWAVEARRLPTGWIVDAPRRVGPIEHFVESLLHEPQPTLAGFDFPIGVPAFFGRRTEFGGFSEAIDAFGVGKWSRFYDVGERAEDVSLYRPFYPRRSSSSARQAHIFDALEAKDIDALRRQCEKTTGDRRAACALFWTLGGNQVGKAAISGWREIIQPARRAGAQLWPFDGTLAALVETGGLVICETYPTEAYRHVGVRFQTRRQQTASGRSTASYGETCVEMSGAWNSANERIPRRSLRRIWPSKGRRRPASMLQLVCWA